MNTESMNALKQVRAGINMLQIELSEDLLTGDEKNLLGDALINLEELEDIIINNMLQEMADKINSSNGKLKLLILQMKTSTARIAAFGNTIKKISDAVGVLAEITTRAISVGIL